MLIYELGQEIVIKCWSKEINEILRANLRFTSFVLG